MLSFYGRIKNAVSSYVHTLKCLNPFTCEFAFSGDSDSTSRNTLHCNTALIPITVEARVRLHQF